MQTVCVLTPPGTGLVAADKLGTTVLNDDWSDVLNDVTASVLESSVVAPL